MLELTEEGLLENKEYVWRRNMHHASRSGLEQDASPVTEEHGLASTCVAQRFINSRHANPSNARFCMQCGEPLSIQLVAAASTRSRSPKRQTPAAGEKDIAEPPEVRFIHAVVGAETISAEDGEWDAVIKLREAMKCNGLLPYAVKAEPMENSDAWQLASLGEMQLGVDEVGWTQRSIGCQFRNQEPLEKLIYDLRRGCADPLSDSSLQIDVIKWPGRGYVSLDNRRMYCFWEHQNFLRQQQGSDKEVMISARVYELPKAFDSLVRNHSQIMEKFLCHYEQAGDRLPRVRRSMRQYQSADRQ